jgi:hypothetical protein
LSSRGGRTRVLYRLAGDDVYELLVAVRSVATARIAGATPPRLPGQPIEAVSRAELLERVRWATWSTVADRGIRSRHVAAISILLASSSAPAGLPAGVEIGLPPSPQFSPCRAWPSSAAPGAAPGG